MFTYQTVIGMTVELHAAPSAIFQCSSNDIFCYNKKQPNKQNLNALGMTCSIKLKKPDGKFKTILLIYCWLFNMITSRHM